MVEHDENQVREPATEDPATADVENTPPPVPVTRGGILAIWIILCTLGGAAVGTLIGMAVPGDFSFAGAIGLGVGVALGVAIGSRRADAKDRELERRSRGSDTPTDL